MITRKKIIPPVTPRIVQRHPRQRLLRYGVLSGALVLAAFLGYYAGQAESPPTEPAGTVLPADQSGTELENAQLHIADLEKERELLRQQVAELEQSVRKINHALQLARSEKQAAEPAPQSAGFTRAENPEKSAPATADNTLHLENVRLLETGSEDTYKVAFRVLHTGSVDDRVTGTIWIAVNGFRNKKPVRLSLKTLSPEEHPFLKMGFNQLQDIEQDMVLPVDFLPKNVLIEVKPYGDKYSGTSTKIDWQTGG